MKKLKWLKVTAICLVMAMSASFAVFAQEDNNIFEDSLEDLSKIYEADGTFLVKHDTASADDMDRIYKSELEQHSIIYKMDAPITGYEVKAYNTKGNIDSMLDIYLSRDGENWDKSSYSYDTEIGIAEGWNWAYIVQKKKITSEYYYLKMTMGDNKNTWNPQISNVAIFMNGMTARPFTPEPEEEEITASFSDYANPKAASVVYGNNVLELSKQNKDMVLSRGEFARAVLEMTGVNTKSLVIEMDGSIKDVTKSTEYASAIYTAVSKKIMSCYADGTFEPDSPITYLQAVKALVNGLGYRNALGSEKEDESYMLKAAQLNLNKGLSGISEQAKLSREQAVTLLFNALNTPPVLIEQYGYIPQLSQDKASVLQGQKDVQERKGQITAVYDGSLSGNEISRENIVEIDGVAYETKDTSITNFLGQGVTYYTDKEDVILAYSLNQKGEAPLTLSYRDLQTSKKDFENRRIVYYENDEKKKTVKIDLNYMSLNRMRADISYDLLTLPDIYLTLYDSDEDGIYDTAMIDRYEYLVVKSANAESGVIQGIYGERIDIETYDKAALYKGGQSIAIGDIKKDDTISMLKSEDGRYLKGYIRTVKLKGKITGCKDDKVSVENEEYVVSEKYKILSEQKIAPELKPGVNGMFYLGRNYEIIGFTAQMLSTQYAYLIQAGCDESESEVFLRLYTESGEFITENVEELRVIQPGKSKKLSGKELEEAFYVNGQFQDQLVIIELNDNGTLKSISKDLSLDYETKKGSYNGSSILCGVYPVTSNSKYFSIPQDRRDYDAYGNKLSLLEGDIREGSSDTKYNMKLYEIDELNSPHAIVVYMDEEEESRQIVNTTPAYVVNEVIEEVNPQTGELETRLYIGPDNDKKGFTVSSAVNVENMTNGEKDFRKLKKGDIILYGLNSRGQIARIFVIFNAQDGLFLSGDGLTADFGENIKINVDYPFFYGRVKNFGSGFLILDEGNLQRALSVAASRYCLYDKEKNEIRKASMDDLEVGDIVIAKAMRFVAGDVIIIRE